jgi:hypothetical protein
LGTSRQLLLALLLLLLLLLLCEALLVQLLLRAANWAGAQHSRDEGTHCIPSSFLLLLCLAVAVTLTTLLPSALVCSSTRRVGCGCGHRCCCRCCHSWHRCCDFSGGIAVADQ